MSLQKFIVRYDLIFPCTLILADHSSLPSKPHSRCPSKARIPGIHPLKTTAHLKPWSLEASRPSEAWIPRSHPLPPSGPKPRQIPGSHPLKTATHEKPRSFEATCCRHLSRAQIPGSHPLKTATHQKPRSFEATRCCHLSRAQIPGSRLSKTACCLSRRSPEAASWRPPTVAAACVKSRSLEVTPWRPPVAAANHLTSAQIPRRRPSRSAAEDLKSTHPQNHRSCLLICRLDCNLSEAKGQLWDCCPVIWSVRTPREPPIWSLSPLPESILQVSQLPLPIRSPSPSPSDRQVRAHLIPWS